MPDVMQAQSHHHYGVSKADLRKSNKPIMEKKRRARINQCLDELKNLILEAMKKDPARHAKLEKADILEMTVKHLQDLQQREMRTAVAADPTVVTKFHSGFNECATEVSRYVSSIEGVDEGVKRRLVGHLTGCLSGLNQVLPLAAAGPPRDEDVNNNTGSRLQALVGLHLLPRLGGSSALAAEHRSAFRAVLQRNSPPVSPLSSDPESGPELCGPPPPDPEKQPPLNLAVRRTVDLIESPPPQPSTSSGSSSSTTLDMWRPW